IYHQPPDYRTGQLSAVFGNPDLKPEGARQYMTGAEVRLTEALGLDVQGYYKDLVDQARQTLASGIGSDVNIPGADSRYTSEGYGRATAWKCCCATSSPTTSSAGSPIRCRGSSATTTTACSTPRGRSISRTT